jgi:VanZ family protein
VTALPPTRAQLGAAACVTAVLVAYASLGPLQVRVGPAIAWRVLIHTWPPVIGSKTDFLSNVLLQAPLGFLLTGAIAADRPSRRWFAVQSAAVLCAALAVAIELMQVSVPSRTPQLIDVVAETIGAIGGGACWILGGDTMLAIARRWWQARGGPWFATLLTYVAGWSLWQWLPFDFTIRPAEVAGKYHAGLIVFSPPHQWPGLAITAIVVAALVATPIGIAADRAFDRGAPRSWPVLGAVTWVLFVAAGQLAVLSRTTTLVLFVASAIGSVAGVFLTAASVTRRVIR